MKLPEISPVEYSASVCLICAVAAVWTPVSAEISLVYAVEQEDKIPANAAAETIAAIILLLFMIILLLLNVGDNAHEKGLARRGFYRIEKRTVNYKFHRL